MLLNNTSGGSRDRLNQVVECPGMVGNISSHRHHGGLGQISGKHKAIEKICLIKHRSAEGTTFFICEAAQ